MSNAVALPEFFDSPFHCRKLGLVFVATVLPEVPEILTQEDVSPQILRIPSKIMH
jgi:hypothetical protein